MKMLNRAISVYLVVMAGWVSVHFFEHTFLEHAEESVEEEGRFATLDAFMALALLLTVVTAFAASRRGAKQSPLPPGWFISNLFFYFTILVAIPFYINWIASWGHTDDGILWLYTETAGPLTWLIQAIRLWRTPTPARSEAVV